MINKLIVIILITCAVLTTSCRKPTEVKILDGSGVLSMQMDGVQEDFTVQPARIEVERLYKEVKLNITVNNKDAVAREYKVGIAQLIKEDYLEGYTFYPVDGLELKFDSPTVQVEPNSSGSVGLTITRTKPIPNTLVAIRVGVVTDSLIQRDYVLKYRIKAVG